MYTTTFYSFKGGVGRSMALVNSAVELATTGRRVLMVDFDLEAPGLDTFDRLGFQGKGPGIVDFVREYLAEGVAPDVDRFLERSPDIDGSDGELWLMNAGSSRAAYGNRFRQLDWGGLYEEHHGYLLFEDLKAQWNSVLNPDYVLIDSRTGHTDVGGICTRQLPDAVAILFFPNEQNLRGLEKVVAEIRAEADGFRKKAIDLHFVISNVPDLDDEDRILRRKLDKFRKRLNFPDDPVVIHRSESMSLLNQVVFTKERPRSRLAGEYRHIVREIVRKNLSDREGALEYLNRATGRRIQQGRLSPVVLDFDEKTLDAIEERHASDGQVLFNLGVLRQEERQLEDASSLFDRAIASGFDEPEAYLRRAQVRQDAGEIESVGEDALRVLQSENVPMRFVRQAMFLLDERLPGNFANLPAVASLGVRERLRLASDARIGPRGRLRAAEALLRNVLRDESAEETEKAGARSELTLVHIVDGHFAAAVNLLNQGGRAIHEMEIREAFNLGMASWGAEGEIIAEPFERVVDLDGSGVNTVEKAGPNYLQCMAVAYWATGRRESAVDFARRAAREVDRVGFDFSCWRYRRVSARVFRKDMDEILSLVEGRESCTPLFMRETAKSDTPAMRA